MNLALWVLQGLTALAFIAAGAMKVTQPLDKLKSGMPQLPPTGVRLIGIAEILGGIGLILPAATGIAPILTPVAAACLAIVMVGAAIFHVNLGEASRAVAPVVLLFLVVIVAYGRFAVSPL
jgi:uncharacterized membrane protein YphA (DoxX/SURF4 family)